MPVIAGTSIYAEWLILRPAARIANEGKCEDLPAKQGHRRRKQRQWPANKPMQGIARD
jgi:hypothetical protein